MTAYPCSGEINFRVHNAENIVEKIMNKYSNVCLNKDFADGLTLEFIDWRVNVRSSNTEPVLRVNIESRKNAQLMEEKTAEIVNFIRGQE
nr:hypothetical protein [Escherichia coli]